MRSIREADINGKRVFLRVDFNVPFDERTKKVLDTFRIEASVPTIRYILDRKGKLILCSHLGRPGGKVVESLRIEPVARELSKIIELPVKALRDSIGEEVEEEVRRLKNGEALFLENIRFYPEEEKNDPEFSKKLANLADIFVNDAFSVSHRAHASVYGIAKLLPSYAGFLLEKEVSNLRKLIKNPEKPFIAVIGGAKIKDKAEVLEKLLHTADLILIGGGMASLFLKAKGLEIGESKFDGDVEFAKKLLGRVLLPVDVVVSRKFGEGEDVMEVPVDKVPPGFYIMDIGRRTIELFSEKIKGARTVFWNGPMGVFEIDAFSRGTRAIASAISEMKGMSIVGGGDTAEFVRKEGYNFTYISVGGGATLEFIAKGTLPGIEVLE